MPELHCTTCDAIVPAGATRCPSCGLQLTTTAAPAVHVERARWPLWTIALGALFVIFVLARELDRQRAVTAAATAESFAADWNAGRLNTPEAFEARCGQPIIVSNGVLHYPSRSTGDYLVTLGASPALELERVEIHDGRASTHRMPVSAAEVFSAIKCK
jgi:hypothetical protein